MLYRVSTIEDEIIIERLQYPKFLAIAGDDHHFCRIEWVGEPSELEKANAIVEYHSEYLRRGK